MSESMVSFPEDAASTQDSMAQVSVGTMLRKVREAQGLHIAALAVSLKVPVKKLDALEADRFDLLPDMVFVRALVCSVCRTLKIDSHPLLERLPHVPASSLKADGSGTRMFYRAGGAEEGGLSLRAQFSRPVVWAVLVLLVGVAVLTFSPFTRQPGFVNAPQSEPASFVPLPATPAPAPAPAPMVPEAALSGEAAASPSSAAVSVPPAVLTPGTDATGLIVLKVHGSSWVEVVDARGVVQVRKNMTDGEVVGVSGVVPLSVVVGRADAVEVQVRGNPFDLTPVARNNVARFEVR